VGAPDDARSGGLPEHLGEAHDRHRARLDQIRENLSRANGRQLIHVPDEDHRSGARHRLQQLVRQRHVNHRALVGHQQITFERRFLVALELPIGWIHFKQPVDRLGFEPSRFRQPLGRPSGWRAQQRLHLFCTQDRQYRIDQCRLPDARPARDDQQL
jgi:hypothetical protein